LFPSTTAILLYYLQQSDPSPARSQHSHPIVFFVCSSVCWFNSLAGCSLSQGRKSDIIPPPQPLTVSEKGKEGKKYPPSKKRTEKGSSCSAPACYIYSLVPPGNRHPILLFLLSLKHLSLSPPSSALTSYPQPSGLPPGVVAGFVVVVVVLANFTIQPQTCTHPNSHQSSSSPTNRSGFFFFSLPSSIFL